MTDLTEGEVREVELHNGSSIRLKKLASDYDRTDRLGAIGMLYETSGAREIVTGIIYVNNKLDTLIDMFGMVDEPLATLPESRVRPPKEMLDQVMEELR